ncbi:subclass B1 metallo-beta-lactamase [Salinimicrobium catena]|uniref:subclass B1 metallo-beta-lactamase n=1 Tax=Salinimicrobium catena TaxID=390640 RepID=UPI002FE4BD31
MKKFITVVFLFLANCMTAQIQETAYSSPLLKIEKLAEDLFVHTSYMEIEHYGNFPVNGMIYFDGSEAIVFDTPIDNAASEELIDWVEIEREKNIIAVMINHFHIDCLGGLEAFHIKGVSSYASEVTILLAKENGVGHLPQTVFDQKVEIKVGDENTITEFPGQGHTPDNMVSYIPDKKAIFGGCLVKEMNAGKGNLADANVEEWPKTVRLLKNKYPEAEFVIPGHGKVGGKELLDYTIRLFEE